MYHSIYIEFTKTSSTGFLSLFLKSFSTFKGMRVNLILPLSYLEKVKDVISYEIGETDQIQLVNSPAYASYSALSYKLATEELMLNEYALGYSFGKKKGFEGEDAVLVKDLNALYIGYPNNTRVLIESGFSLGYKYFVCLSGYVQLTPGLYWDENLGIYLYVINNQDLFKVSENENLAEFRDKLFAYTEDKVQINIDDIEPIKLDLKSTFELKDRVEGENIDKLPVTEGLEVIKIWDQALINSIPDKNISVVLSDFMETHRALS